MKKLLIILLLLAGKAVYSQTQIPISDATKHIGDSVTIQDKVYGVKTFDSGMTLLNLGGNFPNHLLTVMIPAKVKATFGFGFDEQFKAGSPVWITGKIISYKNKPEIIIADHSQLKIIAVKD